MQRLEVSGAVRPIYGSLGVKRLNRNPFSTKRDVMLQHLIGMISCTLLERIRETLSFVSGGLYLLLVLIL